MNGTSDRGIIRVHEGKAYCPTCGKGKLIKGGITNATKIQHLICKCSLCKKEHEVNIEPEPSA